MNFNDFGFCNRGRGRGRCTKGKVNSVTVQKPVMPSPKKPTPKKQTTSSTGTSSSMNVAWKNESSRSNISTLVPTSTSFSTSDAESRIVIALSEGRGEAKHEVGIAVIDVSRPSLILCQISDSQSYINTLTKINIHNPDEILIPMTFVRTNLSNRLTEKIKEHFKHVLITAVPRSTFDKTTGMQFVRELCAPKWNSVIFLLQHRYYALAAASALFTYAEKVLYVLYARESLKIEYQESEGFAFIDIATADGLELVASTSPVAEKKFTSLFGVLNHCLTRIGSRMLRSSILQPPCSIPDIEARLDCVTELKRNPGLMASVQTILSKLTNVDQLLSVTTILPSQEINFSERQMNYILKLNVLLEAISPLNSALKNHKLPYLADLKDTLRCLTFITIKNSIRDMIHSDAHPAKGQHGIFQRCFAIKSDVNGLLDLVRKAYSERIDEMREYVQGLGTKYNLLLSVNHSYKKGFHIVFHLNQRQRSSFKKSDLPDEFIQIDRLSTCITMKTMELINWSTKIDMIQVEILKISNVMIYNMLLEVRQNIGLFYTLCEGIGKLDMLQSLAEASSTNNYVKPVFGEFLDVKNSRHPLLDFLCSTEPTPNMIFASDMRNMHVITGPNGSGKSIFIRQVLLLQVMAQVGSFVPAESARFRVCDRILARISFDDNIEFGVSTFVLEIKEIEYFQTMMTKNTLIIIDELGRSTSVEEGTALAMAICEDFAQTNAFVFFTTHFSAITRLENLHLNITNWQLETYEEMTSCGRRKLTYTYNLIPGVTNLKNYGICCARASWPEEIVLHAEMLLKNVWQSKPSIAVFEIGPDERLKYNLEDDLKIAKFKKQLTPTNLHTRLLMYIEEMNEIGWNINISNFKRDFLESSTNSDMPPPYLIKDTSREIPRDYNGNRVIQNVHEENIVFTPLQNDDIKTISEQLDLAFRFNESLQNSMYFIPEVVHSQSVSGETRYQIFNPETPRENYSASAEVQNFCRENYSNGATLNTSRNYIAPYNFCGISQTSVHTNCSRFEHLKNLNGSQKVHNSSRSPFCNNCSVSPEKFKDGNGSQINAISNPSSHLSNQILAKSRQVMNDRTVSKDDYGTVTSQYKFSLPLQANIERTSTPNQTQPILLHLNTPVEQMQHNEESQEWQTALENSVNKNIDPDSSVAVYDLKSCSENKIQIHSIHVFNTNNELIQVVKPTETRRTENSIKFRRKTQIFSRTPKVNQEKQRMKRREIDEADDLEDLERKCGENIHLKPQKLVPYVPCGKYSQCEPQERGSSQISTSIWAGNDSTNEKIKEPELAKFSERTKAMTVSYESQSMKTRTKNTKEISPHFIPVQPLYSRSSTRKESLCRHSSIETCNSKCNTHHSKSVDHEGQTNKENIKTSGLLHKLNLEESREVSKSRHLSGNYIKLQSIPIINEDSFVDHEHQTNEENVKTDGLLDIANLGELREVSQPRHLSRNYIKARSTPAISEHSSLKTYHSKCVDHECQANEENVLNISNIGELRDVSQSQNLSGRYMKEQLFHGKRGYSYLKICDSKCIGDKSQINEYVKTSTPNLEALREQVSQSRHLSNSHIKEQSFHSTCEHLSMETCISKYVSPESQINEEKTSCLINAPNLRALQEQSPHHPNSYIKEQFSHNSLLECNGSKCIDHKSQINDGHSKASCLLNPKLSENPHEISKLVETSIKSDDDVVDTSQKTEVPQFVSTVSGTCLWLKQKRFRFTNSGIVSSRKIASPKSSNRVEFPDKTNSPIVKECILEQDNVIASTTGIHSSAEAKRSRFSLTDTCEIMSDKKYEEIETFEDIGSCKPKSNANIFGDPIDDVSFDLGHNLSLDLFSDVTVAASTPVASSGDEFQGTRWAKFKAPDKNENTPLIKKKLKSKFVPPKKLTKKEIQNDYFRQDLKMLNVKDETALMKYHRQILNRPSVQQLQQQRHLAVLRNTGEGFEVIPAVTVPKKRRKGFSLKKRESATAFDITLFSDKNSDNFEKFLEGKKSQLTSKEFRLQIEPSTNPKNDLF